jgi:hypothetical protein
MTLPTVITDRGIDELAHIIRDEIEQAQISWRNALRHAMAAGDALNAVQPKVAARGLNWKKWLRENCLVSDRTAQLYQQLARHRDDIESELQRGVELSLRAARKLISGPSKTADVDGEEEDISESDSESVEPEETLEAHWHRATVRARAAFLDTIGVGAVLEAMSPAFGKALRDRVPGSKPAKKSNILNLSANAVHGMRGNSSQHEAGKTEPR